MNTVVSVFAERSRTAPDRPAVGTLTYAELDAHTNRLAHQLIAAGVRPGDVVGVLSGRSPQTVGMLLAVLKAGAAYLALDPRQPPARQDGMLADAGVRVLLADEAPEPGRFPHCRVISQVDTSAPESAVAVPVGPEHLAYVAYTSGSTGRPKGVCVPHRAVVRLTVSSDILDVRADDTFLAFAPVAFDASTLEIWGALLNGARLAVAPAGDLTVPELLDFVRTERVSVMWLTAGLFHLAVDAGLPDLPSLRRLLAGGDVLSPSHVNRAVRALPGTTVVNGYGPTENTTFTCCHPVREPVGATVPIGTAIRGSTVYLLDDELRPVPDGEVGEVYAAGAGLAHGYLGSPAATAARFVADPFGGSGERMYRTGDLARWVADRLEFAGRIDDQVKIRGFRVEPEEIVSVLLAHSGVAQAAVVVQGTPPGEEAGAQAVRERRLVAHVVTTTDASVLELRGWLAERLPDYAVPSVILPVDALPLTANGKVDRAALENAGSCARPDVNSPYREPETALERAMADLWADRLGVAGVGADDDFFELGGHSLLAVRIIDELRRGYGVEVSPLDFYLNPTPAGLAGTVEKGLSTP
ncbi:amino acid adenylation domain-containing protein [Streptomyces sp. NPDC007901]|uniref:amino acid adenylation domain-containing protein n=1 Tax=Streptomyces sp. NPDC007901 TaxID=3364785 RepID=UPI0036EAC617